MTDGKCRSVWDKFFDSVNFSANWSTAQLKSACPPRKKKHGEENGESKKPMEGGSNETNPSVDPNKAPYVVPSQICPTTKPCCFIKMQDACAPCCCEAKPKHPVCPPKCHPQKPREPVCGCDLCKKKNANPKCCDRNIAFDGLSIDPRYFEKV